jgi:hypothetical protein
VSSREFRSRYRFLAARDRDARYRDAGDIHRARGPRLRLASALLADEPELRWRLALARGSRRP